MTRTPVLSQKFCRTNGGCTAVQMGGVLLGFPSSRLRSQEDTAIQMGTVLTIRGVLLAVLSPRPVASRSWGFGNSS